MEIILAIDGGGSRTRCLAVNHEGEILGSGESGPSNHLLVSPDVVLNSLADATSKAMAQSDLLPEQVVCVSAGMAGVDYDGTGAGEMEEAFRKIGFARSLITGDMVIAHAGALAGRSGILALAGTGSCILGIGPGGERVKVGGWGPVYGDEGSAYRIGQTALRVAARAYDGRGPRTMLVSALQDTLDLSDFRATLERVYVERMEPREIAALSRVTYGVAEAGDEAAREIFIQAGEDLAEAVTAAARSLNLLESELLVSYQGSVFEACGLVRDRFKEVLQQTLSGVVIAPPKFEPVVGAVLIAFESIGWNLDQRALGTLEQGKMAVPYR
ncbi:MAG TPA: BadF/BadG/BcrA/BcrD ATPase family protein [Pyrinomonadaceae bacterium]|nr:BadF/BadG/BcrA/BcrD ATPase family protein [Pyrinomonadaceae bacterium]